MTYAYWRVSSREQNEARQVAAFRGCGEKIDKVFGDKLSGKDTNRPQYKQMKETLCRGDLLIIKSIDRLSRKYDDIAMEWEEITKEIGADICVLDMADLLDTRKSKELMGTFISDIVIRLLSFVAETERENIKVRQREGIDAMPVVNGKKVSAKTGRSMGRPKIERPGFQKILEKQKKGLITVDEACLELGISRSKWYLLKKQTDLPSTKSTSQSVCQTPKSGADT